MKRAGKWEVIAHEEVDLMILDGTLPGVPSHEVLSEAVKAWPRMNVILTSAYSR
jgi:DNA-binding NarL/FixJ family response regulator